MKVAVSWSGGKDSCLAMHRAAEAGHEVACLLNLVSREHKRCCFHGIEAELMRAQAGIMGLPILVKEVPEDMGEYEEGFKAAIAETREKYGIAGMVFGDIYLDEHRGWVERVCRESGIEALEPLWGGSPADLAREFIADGFHAVVVSCKADLLGKDDIGSRFDAGFVARLPAKGVCPCGEKGEFHTLVTGGPGFRGSIRITEAESLLKQGFWEHWSLDIRRWEVVA